MFWRYAKGSSLEELIRNLLRIFRQILVVFDGDVEQSLEYLDGIARRYRLWRDDFGPEDFRRLLEGRGEAARGRTGTLQLTPKGERALRRQMLQEVFAKVIRGRGDHRTPEPGGAGEPGDETRGYTFGDPFDALDTNRTLQNWLQRTGGGGGHIEENDLEVRERELHTSCATVLLIDVSHSMTLYGEDRITPAKRVALALTELIQTRYPKDSIDVVLFGDEAKRVPLHRLPYVTNGPFHTNTRAGLIAAQEILKRRRSANRRIIMLTDGKPSAIHREDGSLYKNPFGLDREVVAKTLDEAARCRRKGIPITTFMLTADPYLKGFVESFTETNRGRAYFAESNRLESFVLVDFLRNRRRRVR